MKKSLIAVLITSTTLLSAPAFAKTPFVVSSADFVPNKTVNNNNMLNSFGCTGNNVSPQISWSGAPKGTKSFVLTMYDPDAPTGSGWWHWVAYNIPSTVSGFAAGASADGTLNAAIVQAPNDGGDPHYGGPCPPKGDKPHRYIFTLRALSVDKTPLPVNASPALVGAMTRANTIAKTSFMVKVGR